MQRDAAMMRWLRSAAVGATVCVLAATLVAAFPDGAPSDACTRGMVPNHSGATSQDPAAMPFLFLRESYPGGVRVTIQAADGVAEMKGFAVQARDPSTGRAATQHGSWLPAQGVKSLAECAAVTHADRRGKTGLVLTWQGREDVAIYATILQAYSYFWSNVEALENTLPPSGPSGPALPPSAASAPAAHQAAFASQPGPAQAAPPSPFNDPFFTHGFGKKK